MTFGAESQSSLKTLGFGKTLKLSFSAFRASFVRLAALIVIPLLLASYVQDEIRGLILGSFDSVFWLRPRYLGDFGPLRSMPLVVLPVLAFRIVLSLLILSAAVLAVSSKVSGQKTGLAEYLLVPLRKLPQVLILSVTVCFVIAASFMIVVLVPYSTGVAIFALLGYFAWILVLFYLLAAFSPLFPVILVEKAGWRSMSRTMDLTRGHRWPLAGLVMLNLLLFALLLFLVGELRSYVTLLTLFTESEFSRMRIVHSAILTGLGAIVFGYTASLAVAIFNRLLEVREGHLPNVETVFD